VEVCDHYDTISFFLEIDELLDCSEVVSDVEDVCWFDAAEEVHIF